MYFNPNFQYQLENGQVEMDRMGMDQMRMRQFPSSDINLISNVTQAIILEVQAYNFYQKLSELATNEQDRQIIMRIQGDEARHYHWFTMILRRLGGQQPQIPFLAMPNEFEQGIRSAIQAELEAVSYYQEIAYRATDHMIQIHFLHAANDEQRHASWFEYILMNLLRFTENYYDVTEGIKIDSGRFIGLADANFFEVKISGVPDSIPPKIFMLTDYVREKFQKLDLRQDDEIKLYYYETTDGQLAVTDIEKISQ